MKKFLLCLLASLVAFSLAACNVEIVDGADVDEKITAEVEGVTLEESEKATEKVSETEAVTEAPKPKEFAISDEIKDTMAKNNHLSGANYFIAEDGSVLLLNDVNNFLLYGDIPGLKKIIPGASAVFALTDSGDLYYEEKIIASGIDAAAYCTTNSNVKGYCLKGNDIMWITSDETVYEYSQYSDFRNMITRETFAGKPFSIEVDKHDFFVVNTKGKLFAKVSNLDQFANIDFSGFEGLALADIAKHMGKDDVESLTVAGLKGDGSVVASGTYANEILSWGNLLDIAMSDGMIVGLLPDGTLKMAGDFAEKMGATVESWTNIVAVEAGYSHSNNIGHIVSAMDANGVFYFASLTNENSTVNSGSVSTESGAVGDGYWVRYVGENESYFAENGAWIK